MGYQETDCYLCKACYIKLRKPSKKSIKKMILTTYEEQCENCKKISRLVDYIWDEEDEND